MFNKVKPGGMMDKTLGSLGNLGKGLGRQVIKTPEEMAKAAIAQVSPLETLENTNTEKSEQGENGQGPEVKAILEKQKAKTEKETSSIQLGVREQVMGTPKDENTVDFIKQMYSPSTTNNEKRITNNHVDNPLEIAGIMPTADPNANKTPEEIQKMEALRQQLHKDYVDRTFNRRPPDRPEEAQQEQETAAQRMERMQQEDLQKKHNEDEKRKPIAVVQAANKTESRPGAG